MFKSNASNLLEGPFRHAKRLPNGDLALRYRMSDGVIATIVRSGDGQPARRVKAGWQQRPTYKLSSPKVQGIGEAESGLEADAYRIFDFDPSVMSYRTQPFVVNYRTDGRIVPSYPDAEIKRSDGTFEIVQIKTQTSYRKYLIENHRFRLERDLFEGLGWSYRVLTEVEIRAEPRYSNIKLLRHYRNRVLPNATVDIVQAMVKRGAGATIRSIIKNAKPSGLHEVDIYGMIARNQIRIDLSEPIGPDTRVIALL